MRAWGRFAAWFLEAQDRRRARRLRKIARFARAISRHFRKVARRADGLADAIAAGRGF